LLGVNKFCFVPCAGLRENEAGMPWDIKEEIPRVVSLWTLYTRGVIDGGGNVTSLVLYYCLAYNGEMPLPRDDLLTDKAWQDRLDRISRSFLGWSRISKH
jgi:hypothetical protein